MDPANSTMPTPNPGANPVPGPAPTPEPVMPEQPTLGATPTLGAAAPEQPAPMAPGVAPNPISEPVNTVVTPGVNPIANNPAFQSSAAQGLAATDPIMQPEKAPEPDPIEEELKAPMKAAGPVPGSIGSAVSGTEVAGGAPVVPAENPFAAVSQTQTPSVAFNDPATQQPVGAPEANANATSVKKSNKALLISLIAVAGVIVVALIVILIMQLTSGGSGNQSSSSGGSNSSSVVIDDNGNEEEEEEEIDDEEIISGTLSCTRNMTNTELVGMNDAVSGTISVSGLFDQGEIVSLARVDSVVYEDENGDESEPVDMQVHEAKTADLTGDGYLTYYLPADTEAADLTVENVQEIYEGLDFTCEVL